MTDVISIWLQPPSKVKEEIFEFTKDISKKYKVYRDLNSYKGPHITITEIAGAKQNFENVVANIKRISADISPFSLKTNGVGYFMKANKNGTPNFVIYLKVRKTKPLIELKRRIERIYTNIQISKYGPFVPHITLTHGDLDRKNFYRTLKEYRNLDFVRAFKVDKLMVSVYATRTRKATIKRVKLADGT
jgi:2'-5' RNA ligase